MSAILVFALMQTASSPPRPVIHDAPPILLLAGYNQCLAKEVDKHLPEPITAEEVFEQSQTQCAFWLDAYVAKLASSIALTNIDYQQEKAKFVEAKKAATIQQIMSIRSASADRIDGKNTQKR